MKRLIGLLVVMLAAGVCIAGTLYATDDAKKPDAKAKKSDETIARSSVGFDVVANSFENKGPYGAIVKVGHDTLEGNIRFGAAAHIGVSSDSVGKYRFAIYVTAKNEAGEVVQQNASVMNKEFSRRTVTLGLSGILKRTPIAEPTRSRPY